jgi:hypothetical protein
MASLVVSKILENDLHMLYELKDRVSMTPSTHTSVSQEDMASISAIYDRWNELVGYGDVDLARWDASSVILALNKMILHATDYAMKDLSHMREAALDVMMSQGEIAQSERDVDRLLRKSGLSTNANTVFNAQELKDALAEVKAIFPNVGVVAPYDLPQGVLTHHDLVAAQLPDFEKEYGLKSRQGIQSYTFYNLAAARQNITLSDIYVGSFANQRITLIGNSVVYNNVDAGEQDVLLTCDTYPMTLTFYARNEELSPQLILIEAQVDGAWATMAAVEPGQGENFSCYLRPGESIRCTTGAADGTNATIDFIEGRMDSILGLSTPAGPITEELSLRDEIGKLLYKDGYTLRPSHRVIDMARRYDKYLINRGVRSMRELLLENFRLRRGNPGDSARALTTQADKNNFIILNHSSSSITSILNGGGELYDRLFDWAYWVSNEDVTNSAEPPNDKRYSLVTKRRLFELWFEAVKLFASLAALDGNFQEWDATSA